MNKQRRMRLAAAGMACLALFSQADTWHVRPGGSDAWAGDNWGTAWATIGKALATAAGGDTILVSNGTYLITSELAVLNGVNLVGIGGADATVVARTGSGNHRIFRIANAEAVLDGFTVSNGLVAGTAPANYGGGVYLSAGGTVRNCRIVGNSAIHGANAFGGGLYMAAGVVSNCVVWSNGVYVGTGQDLVSRGGGVYMTGGLLVDSAVVTNEAVNDGMGLYIVTGLVDRCRIAGNYGDNRGYRGGGLSMQSTSAVVRSSLVACNRSRYGGGAWMVYGTLESCTVVSNGVSGYAGGIYATNSSAIFNTVIAYNEGTPSDRDYSSGSGLYRYCCASPRPAGEGNIEADPQFVDPAGRDFRLRPGSACLNAGTNLDWMAGGRDAAGAPRLPDARVDMGAYELQQGPLAANAIASALKAFEPADIVFTAHAAGTNTESLTYYWDFTSDGTQDLAGAGARVVTNRYAAGIYTVSVTISNAAGEGATAVKPAYVKIAPTEMFVVPAGTPVFPYTNWVTASTNLQKAIDAGVDGTTVRVADGVYELNDSLYLTEGILLRSENGPGKTFVTEKATRFTVEVAHSNAVVEGFTINRKGGSAYGGVQITSAGTVRNCIIAGAYGANNAPVVLSGGGYVHDCLIVTNFARYFGVRLQNQPGGVFNVGLLENCLIISNLVNNPSFTNKGYVAGIRADNTSLIRNCVVAGNLSVGFDGAAYLDGATMENCTLVGNVCSNAGVTASGGMRTVNKAVVRNTVIVDSTNIVTGSAVNWIREGGTIEYSCTTPSAAAYGGGNITALPVFENTAAGDYRLAAGSPGVNQGTNVEWMAAATDLAGNPRIGQKRVDMGAYERLTVPTGTLLLVK
jgi:hypothetical protein